MSVWRILVLNLRWQCMQALAKSSANCSYFSFNFQKFLKYLGLGLVQEAAYTFEIFGGVYACTWCFVCDVHGDLVAMPHRTQLF